MMDNISLERMALLHPLVRGHAIYATDLANQELGTHSDLRVASTLRTFEEQTKLYNQRPRVTNSKAGQSYHNYGLALDIVLIIDGKTASWDIKEDWDGDLQSDWMEVVIIMKKHGFKWGGDWKTFKDMPHFEMTFGYNWRDLLVMYNNKQFIEGTTYININVNNAR